MSGCVNSDGTLDVEGIINDTVDIDTTDIVFGVSEPKPGIPIELMITSGPTMGPDDDIVITLNDDGSSIMCPVQDLGDCAHGTWKLSDGRYYLMGHGLDDYMYVTLNDDGTGILTCIDEDVGFGSWTTSEDKQSPVITKPEIESDDMPITLMIVSGPNLKGGDYISVTLDKDGAVTMRNGDDYSRAGTWELSDGQYNLLGFGIDGKVHVIINDDGTGTLSSMGVKWNGKWQSGNNNEFTQVDSTGPTILRYLTTATYREYGSDDWQISGMESYYYEEETPYTDSSWDNGPESIEYIVNEIGINYVSIEIISEGPNDLSSDSKWIKGEYRLHLMNGGYYKLNCDRAWSRY